MKLTKRIVDTQKSKDKTYFVWDSELTGFGLKILPSGKKTYLIQYRMGGRSKRTRRMTIGPHGVLTTEQARGQAKLYLGQVATGTDPASEKDKEKAALTVEHLLGQFFVEHVEVKLKKLTQENYEAVIRLNIPVAFKRMPIEKVARSDIARLHFNLRDRPSAANKTLAVLSKFFNWCEKYGHRSDHTNPCRHVEKYRVVARQRFLSSKEQAKLGEALAQAERENLASPYAIRALKLLSLTGARLREILDLKWEYVDFERGVIELPTSKLANLEDVRIHDLRHTFASVAVNGGMSLPMIGALLGHSQPSTTARYAHLAIGLFRSKYELLIDFSLGGKADPRN